MQLVQYCKALSDETRTRLLALLLRYELNVGEIVQAMHMGQSRISRHLKILLDAGLVQVRRDGLWAFYQATNSGSPRAFLDGAASMLNKEQLVREDLIRAQEILHQRIERTRDFFDAVAKQWDHLSKNVLGQFDLGAELSARMPACKLAVDLGCGSGQLLALLSEKSEHVIGVDNSPKMLETARTRFAKNPRISLRIGELPYLPLRDHEADFAVLSMVLHHLAEPQQALIEASRILHNSGQLLIVEFDSHNNENMRVEYGDHRLGIDQTEMTAWLTRAGFILSTIDIFSVNMGLSVCIYECTKN